jgi:uncharacterized membrane protein YhaH (DUF805 family)
MEWMLLPYRRYTDFQGRSRRTEYWMFFLFTFLVYAVFEGLIAAVGGGRLHPNIIGVLLSILLAVFVLGSMIPSIAVGVRRLHDTNRSGWFVLLGLIPLLGGIIVIVLMCLDGTAGENRFGPDPKQGALEEVF